MPSDDEKRRARVWYATVDIDDYFRRLGGSCLASITLTGGHPNCRSPGSGRYPDYCDWHVPALMTLALDHYVSHQNQTDRRRFEQSVKHLISHRMWEVQDHTYQLLSSSASASTSLIFNLQPISCTLQPYTLNLAPMTLHQPSGIFYL